MPKNRIGQHSMFYLLTNEWKEPKKKWKQFLQSIKCKMKWICWSLWLISFSAAWIFYLWKLFNSSFKQLQHDDDSVSISFSKSSILKYHWIYKEWTIASYSKTSDLHMSWNCSMSFHKKSLMTWVTCYCVPHFSPYDILDTFEYPRNLSTFPAQHFH